MTTITMFARASVWDHCASMRLHKAEAHGAADARLAAHQTSCRTSWRKHGCLASACFKKHASGCLASALLRADIWRLGSIWPACIASGMKAQASTAAAAPFSAGSQRRTDRQICPEIGLCAVRLQRLGLGSPQWRGRSAGACRLELPSIQAALGRTIQAALGRTIQAWQSPPTTSLSDRRNPQPRKLATMASSSLQQEQEDEKAEGRRRGKNNMKE